MFVAVEVEAEGMGGSLGIGGSGCSSDMEELEVDCC